ncbi:hypothetical protein HG530_006974 [Fusarium avenaceum]|nr:hypothetical protein HG530_006974 [Fusarium avenaceum]
MVEQPRLTLVLNDAAVSCPPIDRIKDFTLVGIRTIRALGSSIDHEMSLAGRVHEIIQLIALVNPWTFEETSVFVIGKKGLAILWGQDLDVPWLLSQLVHVLAELGDLRAQSSSSIGWLLAVGVVLVLVLPVLELSALNTTPSEVCAVVGVNEAGGIDAEGVGDPALVGFERTTGVGGDGNADSEDTILVLGGEVQVVFAVLVGCIGRPHLMRGPGNVVDGETNTMVNHK